LAIRRVVNVSLYCMGDGSSTVFTFDLLNTPLIPNVDGGTGDLIAKNWLAQQPAGIVNNAVGSQEQGTLPASISGTVITVTYNTALANNATDSLGFAIYF